MRRFAAVLRQLARQTLLSLGALRPRLRAVPVSVHPQARRAVARRLRAEPLETRRVLSLTPFLIDFVVNGTADQQQQLFRESPQAVAAVPDGRGFVATWASINQDGDGWGIFASTLSAIGSPSGIPEGFGPVNETTLGDQQFSAVAVDEQGNFVVAWRGAPGQGIYARNFSRFGQPIGGEYRVALADGYPSIAMDRLGNFAIVYNGSDEAGSAVFGRLFAPDGTPVGEEFKVNTVPADSDPYPYVAMDVDGDFLVAWNAPDGQSSGIFARRYNALGEAQGDPIAVNQVTTGVQWFPTAAMDAAGNFAVTWTGKPQVNGRFAIYARRFAADGTPRGDEFTVSMATAAVDAQYSRIGMDNRGDMVIVWSAKDSVGDGVAARRYDPNGVPYEPEFAGNFNTVGGDEVPSAVAMDEDGDFLVLFSSLLQLNTSWDVIAQQWEANAPAVAVDDEGQTDQVTPVQIDILANDTDIDGIPVPSTVAIVQGPTFGTVEVNPADGSILYVPDPTYSGPITIGYTVLDDNFEVSNVGFVEITVRLLAARPWQNGRNRFDVDDDGAVAPIDALQIINELNRFGSRSLQIPPAAAQLPPPFYDVDGDDSLAPIDALQVINELNRQSPVAPLVDTVPLAGTSLSTAAVDAALAEAEASSRSLRRKRR